MLAAILVALLKAGGYQFPFPIAAVGRWLGSAQGDQLPSAVSFAIVWFVLQVNVFWPLLNLIPVPPLDGGQIVREGLAILGVDDATRIAAILGVVSGGAVAFWGYTQNEPYLGIMFAMLAVSCYQSLSGGSQWRRWN